MTVRHINSDDYDMIFLGNDIVSSKNDVLVMNTTMIFFSHGFSFKMHYLK
jgi:hypothetical protein